MFVVVIVLIISFPLTSSTSLGFFKESFCLDEISSNVLPLTCPTNHLIKLDRIVYGYSWSNDCSYIDKDCTMNVPADDILCSTINQCTVKVVQDPLILQDCWNLPATYIQAEYECIRDFSLENLCQTQEKLLSEGFLSTPNYPNGFTSNLNCPCLLIAPIGHSILFEFIDIHLPNCSDAALLIWIGDQFQSKCQKQNPMSFIGNPHQNITLRFYSLTNVSRGGVLMKYSILPSNDNATLRLQCFSSPMSSMRNRLTTNFVKLKDLSKKVSTISSMTTITTTNKSKTNVEMVYSIGIVTGCVVLCLISVNVILCCLFFSRSKRSKSKVSTEPMEIPMPIEVEQTPRLRTLHSLLYPERQPAMIPEGTLSSDADLDSHLSEYHHIDKNALNSSSANITGAFTTKPKQNPLHEGTCQINSWDDI